MTSSHNSLLSKHPHHPEEIDTGGTVVPPRAGKISLCLLEFEFSVLDFKPDFHPEFITFFGKVQQLFGLGYCAGEGIDDLPRLPHGIQCLPRLEGNGIGKLFSIDLQAASVALGLDNLS